MKYETNTQKLQLKKVAITAEETFLIYSKNPLFSREFIKIAKLNMQYPIPI